MYIKNMELLAKKDKDASFYCKACAHYCHIRKNRQGSCRVRYNDNGKFIVPFGYISGLQIDPIEKKPFFHVFPGEKTLSFGMLGCNFRCPFCQNWMSSQSFKEKNAFTDTQSISIEYIINTAINSNTKIITSTYNEPFISIEWSKEIFKEAKKKSLFTAFVSNGFASSEALDFIKNELDFLKIDLKCFDEKKYKKIGGKLLPVLETIKYAHKLRIWIEIVTLIVPDFNDDSEEIGKIASFISDISQNIPWHITAFYPNYKMADKPPTNINKLYEYVNIGKIEGLNFIYTGNISYSGKSFENTLCPNCGTTLIERKGFYVLKNSITDSRCPKCDTLIAGRWQ